MCCDHCKLGNTEGGIFDACIWKFLFIFFHKSYQLQRWGSVWICAEEMEYSMWAVKWGNVWIWTSTVSTAHVESLHHCACWCPVIILSLLPVFSKNTTCSVYAQSVCHLPSQFPVRILHLLHLSNRYTTSPVQLVHHLSFPCHISVDHVYSE